MKTLADLREELEEQEDEFWATWVGLPVSPEKKLLLASEFRERMARARRILEVKETVADVVLGNTEAALKVSS